MAIRIEVGDHKSIRIEAVEMRGQQYISLRQMYRTKRDPTWKPGRQGMMLEVGEQKANIAGRVSRVITKLLEDPDTVFRVLDPGTGDEQQEEKPVSGKKKVGSKSVKRKTKE